MPIYEFCCRKCRQRFSVLTLRVTERTVAVCPGCGSRAAERLLSRFSMPRSDAARTASLSDDANLADLNADDPKSAARWMRRMGREAGDDLGGDELAEMADEIERGGDNDDF